MNRKIVHSSILVVIPTALVIYGMLSFVLLEMNVLAWHEGARAFFIIATLLMWGFFAGLILDIDEDRNKSK